MWKNLHHKSTGSKGAMVFLARRVHHILSNKGTENNLIFVVWHNKSLTEVTSGDIFKSVRTAAKILKVQERGIEPDMEGANSLRVGGAMALKIMGYKDSTIRTFGRWMSDTWQMYNHSQISKLLDGVAENISTPIPYQNIAFFDPP